MIAVLINTIVKIIIIFVIMISLYLFRCRQLIARGRDVFMYIRQRLYRTRDSRMASLIAQSRLYVKFLLQTPPTHR